MAENPSTFDLSSSLMKGVQDKENTARMNDIILSKEPLQDFNISPLYQRYIGNTVIVAFNGNFRKFPVDGSSFKIGQGHLNALKKYLRHIDKQIKIAQQNAKFMGDNANGDFKKM